MSDPLPLLPLTLLPAHAFESTRVSPTHDVGRRPVGSGPLQCVLGRRSVSCEARPSVQHSPHISRLTIEAAGPIVAVRSLVLGGDGECLS